MLKINREAISKEIRYVWECPNPRCGYSNEEHDDLTNMEQLFCSKCNEDVEVIDE